MRSTDARVAYRKGVATLERPAVAAAAPLTGRLVRAELFAVLAVSLGADALRALTQFLGDLTGPGGLAAQRAVLVAPLAPRSRPWLDLALQLVAIAITVAPVVLVGYLLVRSRESLATIGFDRRRPGPDLGRGAALAALIGGSGLGVYLAAHALGLDVTLVAANLPNVWWRIPVLLLAAAQWGVLEEVVVNGYLLHRLAQAGVRPGRSLALSATIRGSYHLYQGVGGFAGNLVMGLIFGRLYQRWGRVGPMVVAHTLIDAVAFVGYTYLAGHVSWLPA